MCITYQYHVTLRVLALTTISLCRNDQQGGNTCTVHDPLISLKNKFYNATHSHCCNTLATCSAVGSFLGLQLHNLIKLDLCFSEQGLLRNIDSSVHALDHNSVFF